MLCKSANSQEKLLDQLPRFEQLLYEQPDPEDTEAT